MAKRGKHVQLHNMFVADFETCNDPNDFNDIPSQRVWLAGYKNLQTQETSLFTNLDSFMHSILARGENVNTEYAFHNLKFDGSYIIPWLFKNGYKVSHGKPNQMEFSVLVDNRNNWYSITIQPTKRRKVLLWDLLKLFPMPLEYLPNVYGTTTRKIIEPSSFYEQTRGEEHIPTEEERNYLENDLQVPCETLLKHIELFGLRFKKTQAAQSFYNFEQSFQAWKWRFPPLTTEIDSKIRPAYWGGVSHVANGQQSKDHYDIGVFDINSSYPHKAAHKRLPYGEVITRHGRGQAPDNSKFWIASAIVEFSLKKHCLPCIPSRAILEGDEVGSTDKWLSDSNGVVKLTFSSIDYETIKQSYELTVIRWEWSLHWAWKVQKEIQRFVNGNNENKVKYKALAQQETDDTKRNEYLSLSNRAKIDNNSFYGKFGEDIIKLGKTPYDEQEGVYWLVDREDEQSERARKYLPVAIAITAWGRQQLVQMANVLGEHFIYCDTDSIHYLLDGHHKIEQAQKDGVFEVDSLKLGAWKHEGNYKWGRYLRPKCYMEETYDGELEATVAGLPSDKHTGVFSKKRSCLTKENFFIGTVIPPEQSNKLRTVRTSTGNKLIPVGFEIKERETFF